MTYRASLIVAAALVAVLAAPPAQAGLDWFGLHIGTGGVGVSLGFGSWGIHAASWSTWNRPIDYHGALAGYGEWVWVEGLGQVWRPWVAADWRPYTYGRWVWTQVGWTWVAYEPWGYFPHHYGSWALASVGWVWRPGYVYSPANVVWVTSGPRIGWYACPPRGWSHAARGFHHGYRHGWRDGYRSGYSDGWYDARYASFVGWDRLGAEDLHRHTVVGHAVPRGHRASVLAAAPSREEVVRHGGRAVPSARLTQRSARIDGRDVVMARPEGVSRSVERHASETVGRALRPDVARQLESARVERPGHRTAPRTSAATRPSVVPSRSRAEVPAPRGGSAARTAPGRPAATSRSPAAVPRSRSADRRGPEARIAPAPSPRRVSPRSTAATARPERVSRASRAPAPRPNATAGERSSRSPRAARSTRSAPPSRPQARASGSRSETRRAPALGSGSRTRPSRSESADRGRSAAPRRSDRAARPSRSESRPRRR